MDLSIVLTMVWISWRYVCKTFEIWYNWWNLGNKLIMICGINICIWFEIRGDRKLYISVKDLKNVEDNLIWFIIKLEMI